MEFHHSISSEIIKFCCCRDSIGAQLQLALAKADSEQLARSIAEEQLSDVEKEKTMLELELKEALSRHRDELNKKDIIVTTVSIFIFTKISCGCLSARWTENQHAELIFLEEILTQ